MRFIHKRQEASGKCRKLYHKLKNWMENRKLKTGGRAKAHEWTAIQFMFIFTRFSTCLILWLANFYEPLKRYGNGENRNLSALRAAAPTHSRYSCRQPFDPNELTCRSDMLVAAGHAAAQCGAALAHPRGAHRQSLRLAHLVHVATETPTHTHKHTHTLFIDWK